VLEALRAALAADGDELLNAAERQAIETAAQALETARSSSEYRAIKAAIAAVEQASSGYVERRMNTSINKAMAGHAVDEFKS
jgi:molecular chaperone HscA